MRDTALTPALCVPEPLSALKTKIPPGHLPGGIFYCPVIRGAMPAL